MKILKSFMQPTLGVALLETILGISDLVHGHTTLALLWVIAAALTAKATLMEISNAK